MATAKGKFTMESRDDCDKLRGHIASEGRIRKLYDVYPLEKNYEIRPA